MTRAYAEMPCSSCVAPRSSWCRCCWPWWSLFFLLRVLPGDPSNALLSAGATKEQIKAAQRQVGSDLPLLQQFFSWFGSC